MHHHQVVLPALHQRTSILPRCCHQFPDSLACECTGEGRHPERWGPCRRTHSWGRRGPAGSTHPHPTLPRSPTSLLCPGLPCSTCSKGVPRPVAPHTHTHTLPAREMPPNSPWQHSPHFLSTRWGLQLSRQVLLTSSQEFTQPSAAHHTHSSKEGEKKCEFTAKRGVHKFPSDYQMRVIYGQGKMRQAREELRGGCEEAPPG